MLRLSLGVLLAASLFWGQAAHAGDKVADFSLRDTTGQTVSLHDYEGKVVLLDFWATWCAPCKDELPHLQRMYDDLKDEGFVVLAITTDDARTKSQVKPYVRRSGYTFPVLYDLDSSVLVVHNPSKTLPFSVLVDRDLEVHSVHMGFNPGDEVALREEIEALLQGEGGGEASGAGAGGEASDASEPAQPSETAPPEAEAEAE